MRKFTSLIATAALIAALIVASASATTMKRNLLYMSVLCQKGTSGIGCTVVGQSGYTAAREVLQAR